MANSHNCDARKTSMTCCQCESCIEQLFVDLAGVVSRVSCQPVLLLMPEHEMNPKVNFASRGICLMCWRNSSHHLHDDGGPTKGWW